MKSLSARREEKTECSVDRKREERPSCLFAWIAFPGRVSSLSSFPCSCHAECLYTCLEKRCRMKRYETIELRKDGTGKFVTGFRFLTFKIFSFQDNLKRKLRHAELL